MAGSWKGPKGNTKEANAQWTHKNLKSFSQMILLYFGHEYMYRYKNQPKITTVTVKQETT